MISYFCFFGDSEAGANFRKIIFGEKKLIPLLSDVLKDINHFHQINVILVRYFIDGNISTYEQIRSGTFIHNKRKKDFVVNFRLTNDEANKMNLLSTYKYIRKTTLEAIDLVQNQLEDNSNNRKLIAEIKEQTEILFKEIRQTNLK